MVYLVLSAGQLVAVLVEQDAVLSAELVFEVVAALGAQWARLIAVLVGAWCQGTGGYER